MTVAELIEVLQSCDHEMEVAISWQDNQQYSYDFDVFETMDVDKEVIVIESVD